MTIHDAYGSAFIDVTPDDASYRHREVMGDDDLTLKFSSPVHVEIPVGAWCEFQGERFTLFRPEALTMRHSRDFEYTVTMESEQWKAGIWMFRDLTDGRVDFSLTAKPEGHLQLLVDNLNDRERELAGGGDGWEDVWVAGECDEHDEACIGYSRVRCSEALALMAEAFGTEWEFGKEYGEDGEWTGRRTVALRKVEYGRGDPLEMSYGQGHGFLPDVGRSNSSDDPPVERLYAQGGSDNIDASKYPQELHRGADPDDPDNIDPKTGEPYGGDGTGNSQITHSTELLLPPGRVIGYDGSVFWYEEDGVWSPDGGEVLAGSEMRKYVVDAQGFSVARLRDSGDGGDGEVRLLADDSLDCTEIYPRRVGTVGKVVEARTVTDDDGNESMLYDFTDADPDGCPDYGECLIAGETMTVIFQSGNLAGREFDVNYVHEAEGGKEARRFEVVQQEVDGVLMPDGGAFSIRGESDDYEGDRYAVFGCMLPDSYICRDSDHSGAEWDMLRECVRYMYGREEENHTITGKMDGIWSRKNWGEVGPKVRPGQFVRFTDESFQKEPLLIRITGVKDYLNSPYSPELELSNETARAGLGARLVLVRSDVQVSNDRAGRVSDGLRRVDARLVQVSDDLARDVEDVSDAIWGDDDVDGDMGVVGKVEELEDNLYGTDTTVGVRSIISALQTAVTALNDAMGEVYGALSLGEFDEKPVEGEIGTVNPGANNPDIGG